MDLSGSDSYAGCRYALNVGFNLLNKTIFNYFPYPYTVSAVHVVVGLVYCLAAYLIGAKKASFGRVRPSVYYLNVEFHVVGISTLPADVTS